MNDVIFEKFLDLDINNHFTTEEIAEIFNQDKSWFGKGCTVNTIKGFRKKNNVNFIEVIPRCKAGDYTRFIMGKYDKGLITKENVIRTLFSRMASQKETNEVKFQKLLKFFEGDRTNKIKMQEERKNLESKLKELQEQLKEIKRKLK